MSLDGFIARPDGRLDWLEPMQVAGEDYGYGEFFDTVDTVVIGRRTYEVTLGFDEWPYEGKRVVVLAHAALAPLHGERFFAGSPAALAEALWAEGARRVYVDGGFVVSQFLRAGLLDDLVVSVVPIVLGEGIRLFQGTMTERRLLLRSAEAFPSGLVQLRYRVVA